MSHTTTVPPSPETNYQSPPPLNLVPLTRKVTQTRGPHLTHGLRIQSLVRPSGSKRARILKITLGADIMKMMSWLPGDQVEVLFDTQNRLGCVRRLGQKGNNTFTLVCNTSKDSQKRGMHYSCRVEIRMDHMCEENLIELLNGLYPVGPSKIIENGYAAGDGYRFPMV